MPETMEPRNMISEEEEKEIRARVRAELEKQVARDRVRNEQRAKEEETRQRTAEEQRIRKDEEIRFYTEKGFVPSGTTMDDSIVWQKMDETTLVQKKRRKHHRSRTFKPGKCIKDIIFVAVFLSALLLLYIYYKW